MDIGARFSGIFQNLIDDIYSEPVMRAIDEGLVRIASGTGYRGVADALRALEAAEAGARELALLELYVQLHSAGSEYSQPEYDGLRAAAGIGNLPGGLAPLVIASELIGPASTVADLGAGNGLQGLLMQHIAPHALTIQVELSGRMIEAGRAMQRALGVKDGRIRWVHGDLAVSYVEEDADLIYLYRPVKPHGCGNAIYAALAKRICRSRKVRHIISLADCLGRHLAGGPFGVAFSNEYLTVFERRQSPW